MPDYGACASHSRAPKLSQPKARIPTPNSPSIGAMTRAPAMVFGGLEPVQGWEKQGYRSHHTTIVVRHIRHQRREHSVCFHLRSSLCIGQKNAKRVVSSECESVNGAKVVQRTDDSDSKGFQGPEVDMAVRVAGMTSAWVFFSWRPSSFPQAQRVSLGLRKRPRKTATESTRHSRRRPWPRPFRSGGRGGPWTLEPATSDF